MASDSCARCGGHTPSNDNLAETSFWGAVRIETTTTVARRLRVLATYYRRNPKRGSQVLRVDEEAVLCDDCWSELTRNFLHGHPVAGVAGR